MVAIVSGNTLGLLGGSSATLGQQGTFGNAAIGKSNEQDYLKVSNGNVVVQQRDDFIASKGSDFTLIRICNAQGALGAYQRHFQRGVLAESACRSETSKQNDGAVGTDLQPGTTTYRLEIQNARSCASGILAAINTVNLFQDRTLAYVLPE